MSKHNTPNDENRTPNMGAAHANMTAVSRTQPVDITYGFLGGHNPLFQQAPALEVAAAAPAAPAHVSTANDCDVDDGFFGPMEGF